MTMTPEQRRKLSELVGGEVDEMGNITWPDGKRSVADQPRVVDMQPPMQSGTGYMRSSSGNEYQFTPQGVFQGGQQIKQSVDPEFVPNYSRNPVDLSEVGIGDKTWRVKGKPNMYMSADGTVYDLNQRPSQTEILAQQKQEAEIDKLRSEAEKNRMVSTTGVNGIDAKPMPAAALRLQQDELDELSIASAIQSDIAQARKLIDSKELTLGPIENWKHEFSNYAGRSSKESRNYASFKAMLEKMRNDSLRLNKGVQTEGDAVRAWNEILANINDKNLVKQRLIEVERINKRAALLRENNVNVLRQNYGLPPLNLGGYTNQPAAAVGGGIESAQSGVQEQSANEIGSVNDRGAVVEIDGAQYYVIKRNSDGTMDVRDEAGNEYTLEP